MNIVPKSSYHELFTNVIGRLRDETSGVRKNSLKIYQQLILIYSIMLGAKSTKGVGFTTSEEIRK
jgi:hypothetical protein